MAEPEARLTVLVVDDEENIRSSLRRLLRGEFNVLTAASGSAALDPACLAEAQIILTDQRMPGMTGTAFLDRARHANSEAIPIILTGYADMEVAIAAINTGQLYRYLVKPWDPQELLATLREAGAKYNLVHQNQKLLQDLTAANASLEERVQARTAELAAANARLRALNQFKDEFLAITSHDLRSPLSSIQMAAEVMADATRVVAPEVQRGLLRDMGASAGHLIELVNDLLDVTQLEAGATQLDLQLVQVSEILRASIQSLTFIAGAKHIAIQLDVQPAEPAVLADHLKLFQVFNNLLSNAVKFTRPGGQVQVAVAPETGGVRVSVADTGLGIAADELPGLFTKYRQTRTRATAGEKGTGLGLTIVKQLVELHGGRIAVSSTLGQGTTFSLHFPSTPAAGLLAPTKGG